MSQNRCISCRRNLAKNQQDCPFCGASQSFIRFHRNSLLFIIVTVGFLSWAGYEAVQLLNTEVTNKITQQFQARINADAQQIKQLEQKIDELDKQLLSTQNELSAIKENQSADSSQAQQTIVELKKQVAEANEEAKRQEGRAGWLNKENTRLKDQVNQLKSQVSSIPQNKAIDTSVSNITQKTLPTETLQTDINKAETIIKTETTQTEQVNQ
ncbi:hypothetical protein [Aliikangiella maris]|uniref:Uncharacterized protein n=2 Tax=Aliikangiella maris TaxID=3162458 RepID=A0ABV3MSH4_9GAMM